MSYVDRVEVFTELTSDKALNDERNRARESIIGSLLSENSQVSEVFLSNGDYGKFWRGIKSKFLVALEEFLQDKSGFSQFEITHLDRKGGRQHNFDFLAPGIIDGENSGLKIEFKKGSTIYGQPEFLSLWAKTGVLIKPDLLDYPTYFYENYISDLAELVETSPPSKDDYVTKVFDTRYVDFFETAKAIYDSKRNSFLSLQYDSIDSYLRFLSTEDMPVDFDQIQPRLNEQLEKFFVSWNPARMNFVVEQFHPLDVHLEGTASYTGGKNGLNTIVLANKAGNSIRALLRWKNHACVVGPAWQISLKTAHVS